MRRNQSGFTMVEMMTVVVILAVITSIAVPSMRGFIQRSNAATSANTLLTSFALARSEAVRRVGRVSICPSADGASCTGEWKDGWIVYLDDSNPRQFDDGVDQIVQVFPALNAKTVFSQTVASLSFLESGARDASATAPTGNCLEFIVADNEEARRYVRVSNNGALRTGKGACT